MAASVGCISLFNYNQLDATMGGAVLVFIKCVVGKFLGRLSIAKSKIQILNYFFYFLLSALYFMYLPCAAVSAATVTLVWDKNPEPNILGYKIHYGTTSGSYDYSVDVGNSTSCTISEIGSDQTYYFAATAYNRFGESDFSEEIAYNSISEPDSPNDFLDEVIIDNGDDGTFFSGSWQSSAREGQYGSNYIYTYWAKDSYSWVASLNGIYEAAMWWREYSDRCTEIPVNIYDGDILVDTVYVDQRKNGGRWNPLGVGAYYFSGEARIEITSPSGGCGVAADAVRFYRE